MGVRVRFTRIATKPRPRRGSSVVTPRATGQSGSLGDDKPVLAFLGFRVLSSQPIKSGIVGHDWLWGTRPNVMARASPPCFNPRVVVSPRTNQGWSRLFCSASAAHQTSRPSRNASRPSTRSQPALGGKSREVPRELDLRASNDLHGVGTSHALSFVVCSHSPQSCPLTRSRPKREWLRPAASPGHHWCHGQGEAFSCQRQQGQPQRRLRTFT